MLWNKAFANPGPFVTDELVRAKVALARQSGAQPAFLKTLRSFVGWRGFRPEPIAALHDALPAVTVPTLVVWGRDDHFVPPSHAELLLRHMRGAELQLWERCGHAPQIECAERFNVAALSFWARADGP